jgi:hypothetical protein
MFKSTLNYRSLPLADSQEVLIPDSNLLVLFYRCVPKTTLAPGGIIQ